MCTLYFLKWYLGMKAEQYKTVILIIVIHSCLLKVKFKLL